MAWERGDGRLAASVGLVQLVSLRSLDKYIFHDRFLTLLAAAALGTAVFLLARNYERVLSALPEGAGRFARSPVAFRALALVLAGISLVVYPMADGLKAIGRGSDGDDAMILAAANLLAHFDPYRSSTYLGNPISSGPGWVLLASPWSVTGLWALFFPSALVVLYLVGRKSRADSVTLGRGAIALLSGLGIWEMMATGGDLFPVGVGVVVCLFVVRDGGPRGGRFWLFVALFALFLTSRVILPLLLLPVVFLYLLRERGPVRAWTLLIASALATAAVHLVFYLRATDYMPLHLVTKGIVILTNTPRSTLALLGAGATAGTFMVVHRLARREFSHEQFVVATAAAFGVPLLVLALADLARRNSDLAGWESSNYAMVAVPSCVYAYVLARASTRESTGSSP